MTESKPVPRKTSPRVATSPGCLPLRDLYEWAERTGPSRWTDVEGRFLQAMWEFDRNVAEGRATQGDIQNGKGDFFTDLIALVLENASGKPLYGRGAIPGLFFPSHNLDASYPPSGDVEVLIETKAAGAPKSGRNPKQKNPQGRPGSADLRKRITETGLKTIDLKAEHARREGRGEGPAGDLVTWLRRSKPLCVLFLAIRVVDARDLKSTVDHAAIARQILDDVGLVAYKMEPGGERYRPAKISSYYELDRILSRVASLLRSLPKPDSGTVHSSS